jgi:hypothetical protein
MLLAVLNSLVVAVGRPCPCLRRPSSLSSHFSSHHTWPPCGAGTTLRVTICFHLQQKQKQSHVGLCSIRAFLHMPCSRKLVYQIWAGGSRCPSSPKLWRGFNPPWDVLGKECFRCGVGWAGRSGYCGEVIYTWNGFDAADAKHVAAPLDTLDV